AAARASESTAKRGAAETRALIARLPEKERTEYLFRVVEGDQLVGAELARRLDGLSRRSDASAGVQARGARTVRELLDLAGEQAVRRRKRNEERVRKARIQELELLARQEQIVWD